MGKFKYVLLFLGWLGGWGSAAFFVGAGLDHESFYRTYSWLGVFDWPVWLALGAGLFAVALRCRITLGRMERANG